VNFLKYKYKLFLKLCGIDELLVTVTGWNISLKSEVDIVLG
jgi:hypothetical protein